MKARQLSLFSTIELSENKAAITFYLASSPMLTPTVMEAIANDRLVRKEFNLTEIFLNGEAREEFLRDLT